MFKMTLAAILLYLAGTVLVYAAFAFIEFERNPFYWYFTTRVVLVIVQVAWAVAVIMAVISDD